MTAMQVVFLLAGLVLLLGGAELLVKGASRLAIAVGLSPLVVGLTVVAYGTSSPELAVSLQATMQGNPDVAYGNVVGSNIFNILFILGISALVAPLVVHRQLVRREVPMMVAVSVVTFGMCFDERIGRIEGMGLLLGGIGYTAWTVIVSRRETSAQRAEMSSARRIERSWKRLTMDVAFILAGLALLVLGSRWLLEGAVSFARWLGLSDLVIGLTIIAAGTSLPEVATSILASIRGERDIAVGNVVGSNIFNLLVVLGGTAAAGVNGVPVSPAAVSFDTPVMLAVSVACLPIFFTGWRIARWEGGIFLAYYLAYAAYLILDAQKHDALHGFSQAMLWFVLPITGLTLAVITVRQLSRVSTPSSGGAPAGE